MMVRTCARLIRWRNRRLGNRLVVSAHVGMVGDGARPPACRLRVPRPDTDYTGTYRYDVTGQAPIMSASGGALGLSFERPGTSFGLVPWNADVDGQEIELARLGSR